MEESDDIWPIEAWYRLAIVQMHLSPDDFWNMPLRDWFWLCQTNTKPTLRREDLDALMAQFPDNKEGSEESS